MRQPAICFFILVFLSSLHTNGKNPLMVPDTSRNPCQPQARRLLDETLELMHKYYYNKQDFDWYAFTRDALQKLEQSSGCEESYTFINACLRKMGESHSFIMPPVEAARYKNDTTCSHEPVTLSSILGKIIARHPAPDIAYLSVPWIRTMDDRLCTAIADSLQQVIRQLDLPGVDKWIIDLRNNSGGNCWPMLAGLGPLLGEGVCGYFVSGREKVAIRYSNGAAFQGKYIRCQVKGQGYCMNPGKKFIVVITGPRTSSAGEIVAIAFRGKEDVFHLGEPTAGFTTANSTYTLSDHSMLVLSVCREADRTGTVYEGRIHPDEKVESSLTRGNDAVMEAALFRLRSLSL